MRYQRPSNRLATVTGCLSFLMLGALGTVSHSYAQCNAWTQKADFGGTARRNVAGFSIGTK
ncbi:MAG: hypothetical protein FVQ77_17305, partial [Cytophagales bacterium]|nr:hypothetical protein [Cytophagales bacterium]